MIHPFDQDEILDKGEELEIRTFPDPVLKKVAEEVTDFNDELRKLCLDMCTTMYEAPGIGLAAPQVGVSKRIFISDIEFDRDEVENAEGEVEYRLENLKPWIFINPKIEVIDKELMTYQEGCLSLPGIYEDIKRPKHIKVTFKDIEGNEHEIEATGLFAVCIQHENDHLDGIVMLDKMSQLKRNLIRKKLIKEKKRYQTEHE